MNKWQPWRTSAKASSSVWPKAQWSSERNAAVQQKMNAVVKNTNSPFLGQRSLSLLLSASPFDKIFEIDLSISFWRPSITAGNLCTLFLVLYASPWLVMMLSIGSSDLDTVLRAGDFCAVGGRNVWDKYIFKVTLFILVLHTSTVALSLSLNTVKFQEFSSKFFGQVTHPFLILVLVR
jgi:hypothetical protein